jgi:hypothetical protein
MGLPSYQQLYDQGAYMTVLPEKQIWQSACGRHPDLWANGFVEYAYYPGNEPDESEWYYKKHEEKGVLVVDPNCWDHGYSAKSFTRKKLLGVRLNGSLDIKWVYGYPTTLENWN